jgi:glycosyltransferase involved in cell wall biosynthesis
MPRANAARSNFDPHLFQLTSDSSTHVERRLQCAKLSFDQSCCSACRSPFECLEHEQIVTRLALNNDHPSLDGCRLLSAVHDPGTTEPTRIAVLNSHPIQYFAPLYAYLNAAPDLDVTALYLSDFSIRGGKDAGFARDVRWDVDLLAGYRTVFLGEAAHKREPRGFWSLVAPQVWNELRSGRYDVVLLHGHNYVANFIALLAAKTAGLPVMMRGETHLGLPCHGIKSTLRRPLVGALYRACDRLLAIGSANAGFYRAMGVPDHKVFLVPYSVDNERFVKSADLTHRERIEVRKRYKVPADQPAVLYAAKFTRRKRPGDLLDAVKRLKLKMDRPFTVVMAGSGELEHDLRTFCAEHRLDNVVFAGFVNQSELPTLYAASDVFVLPSEHEPWGLAVNEAMCAGLPVVVSREVGCVADLVGDGVNGYTPAAGDINGLACALQRLLEDEDLRRRQGRESLARILGWGYEQCLEGIRSALAGLESRGSETNPVLQTHGI